jgi:hypothetical protein
MARQIQRRAARIIVAAAITIIAVSASVPLANAATPVTSTSAVSTPMTLTYVSQILSPADSSGQVLALLSNGATISLPTSTQTLALQYASQARSATVVSPDSTVYGNCGSSYVQIDYKSNGKPVHMDTGFSVIDPAVDYSWRVTEAGSSGTGYNYSYHASGSLANRSTWHGQHSSGDNYPSAAYEATVVTGSFAELNTGAICYSGSPSDEEYLIG